MAARDPQLRRLAARAGGAAKNHLPDADQRRAQLAETRLAHHITRVVAQAPELSDAQKDRLAALLQSTTDTGERPVAS